MNEESPFGNSIAKFGLGREFVTAEQDARKPQVVALQCALELITNIQHLAYSLNFSESRGRWPPGD